ncbi:MAG: elongation factor 1-beta [Candidatus Hydrothermarchaeales archaeon]
MSKVLVILKVMPEGLDSNLDEMSEKLKTLSTGRFNSLEKEPIAFGLVALKPSYVVEDAGGVTDNLEKEISGIDGVKTVEVVDVSLI